MRWGSAGFLLGFGNDIEFRSGPKTFRRFVGAVRAEDPQENERNGAYPQPNGKNKLKHMDRFRNEHEQNLPNSS